MPLEDRYKREVDNLVDILYRGIVHTTRTTSLGVKRTLKHTTEDSRRNLAPVEVEGGVL